jgi:hypothetical protein
MASNISSRGTIENFLHQGITPQDGLMELNDNEIDAGATKVVIRIDTETRTLTVSGDGKGMDKDGMTAGLRINNTRPASEAIGLRGVGGKAGLAVLSGLEESALIISRREGQQKVFEAEIDWPKTMREDRWAPSPSALTRDNGGVWDANRVNPEHGTVVQVKMPQATLAKLQDDLAAELVRVYEPRLGELTLQVVIDGVDQELPTTRALGYAVAPHKLETRIQLLRNPTTGEMRGYLERDFRKKKVWARKGGKAGQRDLPQAVESGFECVGEFRLLSVFDPRWESDDGYMSPCRNGRFLGAIPTKLPAAGDYWQRKVLARSRHGLMVAQESDEYIGVQVNKSAVSREVMNPALLQVVEWAMSIFSTNTANKIRPPKPVPPAEEAQQKKDWKMIKDFANHHEGFLAAVKAMAEDWVDEEEDEEEN